MGQALTVFPEHFLADWTGFGPRFNTGKISDDDGLGTGPDEEGTGGCCCLVNMLPVVSCSS